MDREAIMNASQTNNLIYHTELLSNPEGEKSPKAIKYVVRRLSKNV